MVESWVSFSRTLPKFVTPPRTALFVKNHLCKIEGLSAPTSSTIFESLSSETAAVESSRLAFGGCSGPGSSENDPIVLVVGVEDAEKRLASTAQSERLPEAVLPEPRYGTSQNVLSNLCSLVSVQPIIASTTKMAHWHPRCLLIRKTHPWHRYSLHPTTTNSLFVEFPSHEGRGLCDSNCAAVPRHGRRGADD